MNDPNFEREYSEQNRRDQIGSFKLVSILSIILVLFCYAMDRYVYPDLATSFLKLRIFSALIVGAALLLFSTRWGQQYYRVLGIVWYAAPLSVILWMIYAADDPQCPYYAGLNIVLLAVGLLSPWTFRQNLITAASVLVGYLFVCLSMKSPLDIGALMNNTTFLILTAVIVVSGSYANAMQRRREFELRWELERNRKIIEENNRKLVELDQTKSRFFANISHELRTPLTLLLAPLDALRTRFGRKLDREGQELLGTMRDNGMRLLKLINDLLDLVRLEEGRVKVDCSPVDLGSVVGGLVASVQHTATTRDVSLSLDLEPGIPTALLDRDKLEKTLLNLLFNALKFTNAGGSVTLGVNLHGDRLVFAVADTGIGISEEDLEHLFQRFWQADGSSHRKHQGAGIGLSLVKEFTEAQSGTVRVTSQLGTGTTFTVELPFVAAPDLGVGQVEGASTGMDLAGNGQDSWLQSLYREAQMSPARGQHLAEGGQMLLDGLTDDAQPGIESTTVLVADDEPDMLRFVKAQLGSEYRVVSAKNGREAVERASEVQPSVIVLDMMMPEMDGIEACRVLRKDELTAHVPIIMLTARVDEETKLTALAAGANDFIIKPFSVTELQVRVRNLVERHRSRMKLSAQNAELEEAMEQLRETEMQLLQSEKLASLGELSAGMSHEIKNPLNYALTGVYALKNRGEMLPTGEQTEYAELVGSVEEGVRRVMDTVNTLSELVHPQVENKQDLVVADTIQAALRLLGTEWKGRVSVHTNVLEDVRVHANKSMVLLVMLNILKNAMDALREQESNEGPAIWIEAVEREGRTTIRIRDNGPGIAPQYQPRIFDILGMGDLPESEARPQTEPAGRVFKHFFSTKAPGAGMGMGLSICRRIVRAHNGKITFRSEPGEQCEFILEFPAPKVVEAQV